MISIIVPCYIMPDKNAELVGFTENCFKSMRKEIKGGFELVVVDNGSPIGGDMLRAWADLYVRNKENLGFAKAVNQGFKVASGEWLVACNNDIEFIHDWPATAIEAWTPDTGAISSHLHDHDKLHKAGRMVAPWGHMFGALWMTHQSVVDKVGLLDEGYIRGMYEDKDYWMRLLEAQYILLKAGWCNHIGNATWGKLPHQHKIFVQNKERFEAKWGL